MIEELERCPFCRGEAVLETMKQVAYWVRCSQCNVKTEMVLEREQAIRTWNTRAEKACRWRKDREEWSGDFVFHTECDDEWWLDYCNPQEAGYTYCANCGGKIEAAEANETMYVPVKFWNDEGDAVYDKEEGK